MSKLVFNVAEIGFTALIDKQAGAQKWQEYVAPITQLIDSVYNKQISLRHGIKGATKTIIEWKTQDKLLGGLGSLFRTTRKKAVEFFKNNPLATPEQYMATPEGKLFKVVDNLDSAKDSGKNLNLTDNSAHSIAQFEKLKNALKVEEFTSIIKVTKHGLQRLIERGFTSQDVLDLVKRSTYLRTQNDGATVFIKEISNNVYNYMVVNEISGEVITCLKKIDKKALQGFSNNYGWKL